MASKLICPLMTARVTRIDTPQDKPQTITPQTVMCQEDECALWDKGEKVCCFLSGVMKLQKILEAA